MDDSTRAAIFADFDISKCIYILYSNIKYFYQNLE